MLTFLATASSSGTAESNDRGVIHQLMIDVGFTQARAHTIQVYADGPIRIVLVLVIAFILTRLVKRAAPRLIQGLRIVSPLVRSTTRGADRVQTLAGAFSQVLRAIIWLVALLTILGQLDINLLPFVATATVIGMTIGFGAQTLVKDFLSGILILAEDQYGVGDSIVIGAGPNTTTGTVESVNLRVTRLRGLDGVVWYVPNGDVRTVGNNTESDSQALVDVVVPYGTDLDAAGRSAEAAAKALASEPEWRDVFIGPPIFAGVQASDAEGVTIRVTAATRPGQHFRAARELRLRVIQALRADSVAWAEPQKG